jgi:hypothetical protein
MCGDKLGGQARIGFEGGVKVGAGIELAEQFVQRARTKPVNAAREVPQTNVWSCVAFDQGRVLYRAAQALRKCQAGLQSCCSASPK